MKQKILYSLLLFAIAVNVFSQQKFTLSGTVANDLNNETLIDAMITIPEANTSVSTNAYGFYSITLPEGEYTVIISYPDFTDV